MLPSVKNLYTNNKIDLQQRQLKKQIASKSARASEQAAYYEQRCQNEMTLNSKLKQLFNNLKSNVSTSQAVNAEEQEIAKVIKERKKQETEAQHQAHALNILISENGKLKQQVDSERNKRAIYFNVYKNLEHEIHHWEVKYKNLLIEIIKSEGAAEKIKQKYRKVSKKIQKDIQTLNLQIQKILKVEQLQQKAVEKIEKQKSFKQTKTVFQSQKAMQKISKSIIKVEQQNQYTIQIVRQQSKKCQEQLQEFELEHKNLEVNGLMTRLKQISKLNDINEIIEFFKGIDEQIQYHFSLFKEEERRQKDLIDLKQTNSKEIQRIQAQNQQRKSTKVLNQEGKRHLVQNTEKIKQLQEQLQQKIGVKVSQMSNQMLLHHCLRVRDDKREGKKNLQKYLEQVKKEKPEAAILLSPKQMHKKIIQSQTSMI